jgi:hypothetical protein
VTESKKEDFSDANPTVSDVPKKPADIWRGARKRSTDADGSRTGHPDLSLRTLLGNNLAGWRIYLNQPGVKKYLGIAMGVGALINLIIFVFFLE